MSGVEAAASLFGPEDSASDLFATLGEDTGAHPATESLFLHDNDASTGDFLSPHSNLTSHSEGQVNVEETPNHTLFAQESVSNQYEYSTPSHSSSLPSTQSEYEQPQDWYGHDANGASHDGYSSIPEQSNYYPPSNQTQGAQSYEPYAPSSNYARETPAQTTAYAPYTPAQPATNYAYSQPVTNYTPPLPATSYASPPANQASAYSAYSPYSSTAVTTQPFTTSYAAPYQSEVSTIPAPPPPAPAPVTRPKISNAYDPPFPTTRTSKRTGGRAAAAQQPFASPFASYQAATPSPPITAAYTTPNQLQSHTPPPPLASNAARNTTPYSNPYTPALPSANEWPQQTAGYIQPNQEIRQGPHDLHTRKGPYSDSSGVNSWASDTATQSGSVNGVEPAYYAPQTGLGVQGHQSGHESHETSHYGFSDSSAVADDRTFESKPYPYLSSPPNPLGTSYLPPSRDTVRSPPLQSDSVFPQATDNVPWNAQSAEFTSPPLERELSQQVNLPPNGPVDLYAPNHQADAHRATNPYAPADTGKEPPFATPQTSSFGPYNTYLPKEVGQVKDTIQRSSSPGSYGLPPTTNGIGAPPKRQAPPVDSRNRSASNGSMLSVTSTGGDSYAPTQHRRQQTNETDYGPYTSRYNYQAVADSPPQKLLSPLSSTQELSKPQSTLYAPSPSLLGANDPLGRTSVRVPVFSFGFGGKLVTCFHGAASLSTGFDVALSSRVSTGIHVRLLKDIIPKSALEPSESAYPGPLFSDPGSPTTSLVRTGQSTQTKTKKTKIIKYLTDRAEEIDRGLNYMSQENGDRRSFEDKLVLVRLLKVLAENDGKLSGSAQIDSAVRAALIPGLEEAIRTSPETQHLTPALGFGDGQQRSPDLAAIPYPTLHHASLDSNEAPLSTTTLRPSSLDKIQDFLVRGDRRQAYHYALDEKLWAHAMVIASSIDKDSWKEVVNEFLKVELGVKETGAHQFGSQRGPSIPPPQTNGREGLRVAYSVYSGQGAAAVQEMIPQTPLAHASTNRLQVPLNALPAPRTPILAAPAPSTNIPTSTLSSWAKTVAMILSNPLTVETSAALTALGDQLLSNQCVEAAHACYLLSPQTSPIGGLGNPAVRVVLCGSRSPQVWPIFAKDPDPVVFTEILEFALSLNTPPKGQEPFTGFPHLQPFKYIRAMALAEIGEVQLASRYCEAITASLSRGSPYLTPVFLDQLKGFSDRIAGVAHQDKAGSWIGGKISKPSLDTIGGWLEGRFTQLVTGDADKSGASEEDVAKADDRTFSGPFSQYSTISSAAPSTTSSPKPSLSEQQQFYPPPRSGSAMAASSSSSYNVHPQIDRASSAMDYVRRKPSPAPRIASASATTTNFPRSISFGQVLHDQSATNGYASNDTKPFKPDSPIQEASWWGATSYADGETPTTATFMKVDGAVPAASSEGFISLMDTHTYDVSPQPPSRSATQSTVDLDEDEEDLGFGNSRSKPQATSEDTKPSTGVESTPTPPKTGPDAQQKDPTATESAGWLSRWWKRSDSLTPGPVKASLGEESSFYYDKEQKRWVNRKAGDPIAKPSTPPPPPSRAQTASPGMTGSRPPVPPSNGQPPTRSASAIDLTASPPKSVMRVRSNLVPISDSAPNTPIGARPPSAGPPRPKSQASKKSVRSRYVDVFQQEGAGGA